MGLYGHLMSEMDLSLERRLIFASNHHSHTHIHTHLSTTSRPLQHVCCSTSISLSQSISGSSEKNHWYRWMEPSNSLRERAKRNFNGFLNNVSMSANTHNHLSGLQKKVPKRENVFHCGRKLYKVCILNVLNAQDGVHENKSII